MCAAVAVIAAFGVVSGATGAELANNGRTAYCIVVAKDAIQPERTAAKELQSYLRQITSAEFPIRTESQVKPDAPQILVGPSQRARRLAPDVDWAALGHDGIVIRTVGNRLILAGGRPRGTLYAVYTFLEDSLGCRWWTGTESTIPHARTIGLPKLDVDYTPKLLYREAFYRDPNENPLFAAKLKLNGHFYSIPAKYGGHYSILGWCHTSNALLPPDKYFSAHPDWYALVDGKRQTTQLCLSNDEMRKELTRAALEWIAKDPTAGIISISQNDCGGWCQCPKCRAIEQEEGSPSGPLIRFVNAVAEEIEKKYPDMLVETLAYQYTRKPPLHVRPRKNVVVRLCSIECDFAKPLESPANASFGDDLRKWAAIAPNLYIWNYVTDFSSYIQPQPNMASLAPDLRFFVANKTIGVFEQGDSGCSVGDFVRLRAWLLAHLEWDPSRDPKQLIAEFLKGYYGAAGPYLQQYLDLVNGSVEKTGQRVGCYNGDLSFLTLDVMTRATRLFDQAAKAVADDSVLAGRVRRDRMPLDLAWLLRYDDIKREAAERGVAFVGPSDPMAACREFIALAREWKANMYSESRPFESCVPGLQIKFGPPPPKPEEFAQVAEQDKVEVHAGDLLLMGVPDWVKLVNDPKAADGKAAVMPGGHTQWAVQYHISDEFAKAHPAEWKWYVIARSEGDRAGAAFNYGIYDANANREIVRLKGSLEQTPDGNYRTYYLGTMKPEAGMYVWLAPLGNGDQVKAIYVDRVVLVRDRGE